MSKPLRAIPPLIVLGVGVTALVMLVKTKPPPAKVERTDPGALVDVIAAEKATRRVTVRAHGTIVPAREVRLSSEVNARVRWVHDRLQPGGQFRKGETIVRLDARDFELAAAQQAAAVDRARTELQIERSRKEVAEREWELFARKGAEKPASEEGNLALREPQLRTAQVSLESARSALGRARLAVSKTAVRVPFNAFVRAESVEVGQMVGPQAPLVTLVGTDQFWVQVSIPVNRLSWVTVPGIGASKTGSKVRVIQEVGGEVVEREGEIVRLLGEVDPAGRMARLLVAINDPLGLKKRPVETSTEKGGPAQSHLPLLLGAYVDVELAGREVEGVIELPRTALRDGDSVYLYVDGKLEIREVDVIWARPDTVLIAGGLENGEKVIVSPVPSPVANMKLRLSEAKRKKPEKKEKASPTAEEGAKGERESSPTPTSTGASGSAASTYGEVSAQGVR